MAMGKAVFQIASMIKAGPLTTVSLTKPQQWLRSATPACSRRWFALDSRGKSDSDSKSKDEVVQWRTARLETRSVVRVHGKDASAFLQGLITNDIHLLDASADGGPRSIYSLMLNLQGRVMFDLFIYTDASRREEGGFLVDCDALLEEKLVKHLKAFKLRKDVSVESASAVGVRINFPEKAVGSVMAGKSLEEKISSHQSSEGLSDHLKIPDPRLPLLGYRSLFGLKESAEAGNSPVVDETAYRRFRYRVGVPEGSLELPPGECFPLESNADYLAGVHFHKGCYLGQELTARTHHTGVVRKRLMPVAIEGLTVGQTIPRDAVVAVRGGTKPVGKLRAHVGPDGLALLRIEEALAAADNLVVSHEGKNLTVRTKRPEWWPDAVA
ncbi:putative transferase CAF17-like protein, mitochondrial [Hypsibius exemplaris]|uniref:Transferase CAF17-like protein, mitochondrial n=1 Tax=Hypsibius exemplaris TaxID=2072580 RepID=A0A1W0WWS8_HYPEX|nr:putative transferase CAF17-like protein, mitochondrial [Hypsibius exemplaris]